MQIEEILNSLSIDEMIGQMLCFTFTDELRYSENYEKIEEYAKKYKPGGFFVSALLTDGQIEKATKIIEKYTKVPVIVASDIEIGPNSIFPEPMAWGACDDAALIEKAHRATAEYCRKYGLHWSFSPIVDINMNPDNPVTNVRAISDSPKQVAKIGAAAIRGMQYNGLMAAGCKHFPGDGVDDRNQHFCTTMNSLSKEEWMDTFGYVYKKLIAEGASSIMVGHISLPAYDEKLNDWIGYPPASISYNLQTKLLRETLGYDGCIISDAMSMVGVCAAVPADRVAVEFVKAGGDMVLFPLPEYFDQIRAAVMSGEIPESRIRDAVRHILMLKEKVRLFENQEGVLKDITNQYDVDALADEIADKSISLVRNYDNILPLNLKKGDKILSVILEKDGNQISTATTSLGVLEDELKKRGFEVKSYINPRREDIYEDLETAAVVLVNINVSCRNWNGGGMRIGFPQIATLWRGAILKHPKCIFTAFGDPYKIHEFPYVKNYINTHSGRASSQRAFVKALLGEIPFQGKNPVEMPMYFKREVE